MRSQEAKQHRAQGSPRFRRRLTVGAAIVITAAGVVVVPAVSASAANATMSGRAYTLAAAVGLLGSPESTLIAPVPDTGAVTTTVTSTTTPACINIPLGLIVAHALCDSVSTHKFTSRVAAKSTLADISIGLPGVPAIQIRGIKAWSTITCGSSHGTTTIAFLKIGGQNLISRKTTFSNGATFTLGPVSIQINETLRTGPPGRSRSVIAVHVRVNLPNIAVADVIIGAATASTTNCAPDPT
jgi:hypothetical protein